MSVMMKFAYIITRSPVVKQTMSLGCKRTEAEPRSGSHLQMMSTCCRTQQHRLETCCKQPTAWKWRAKTMAKHEHQRKPKKNRWLTTPIRTAHTEWPCPVCGRITHKTAYLQFIAHHARWDSHSHELASLGNNRELHALPLRASGSANIV